VFGQCQLCCSRTRSTDRALSCADRITGLFINGEECFTELLQGVRTCCCVVTLGTCCYGTPLPTHTRAFYNVKGDTRSQNCTQSEDGCLLVVAPSGLVEFYRLFRGACCLDRQTVITKAARTSETSVKFYQTTRRCNPEYRHLQCRVEIGYMRRL
jgi:hypothetical protein